MQIFHVISVFVPLALFLVIPIVLQKYGFKERPYRWLLAVGCMLFCVSWYLPSPLIDGQDTSFVTHFVGGGVFVGFLWLYLKYSLNWQAHWLIEAFSLFALVSALGCVNELAELFMVKAGIASILLADTNWDIVANTSGALSVYLAYLSVKK